MATPAPTSTKMDIVPTRLGDEYQAEIPLMLAPPDQKKEQKKVRSHSLQKWTPSKFTEDEVTEYLRCTRLHDTEAALRCLHEANFDVAKAAKLLHSDRQQRLRAQRQLRSMLDDGAFETAIRTHGKKFFVIKEKYPGTTTGDLIARFYEWKLTTPYKKWHEGVKAKKNKETARLRQWADKEESDTSDFHNEHCELCFTGGQLLCCDGCERAYHFSCVEPPIKDVPMGDWFCFNCASILGTSLLTRSGIDKDGGFCEVVVREEAGSGSTDDDDGDDDGDGGDTNAGDDVGAVSEEKPGEPHGIAPLTIKVESAMDAHTEPTTTTTPSRTRTQSRLYTPDRHASSFSQLTAAAKRGTECESSSSTNRKRQRKVVAPRRIPQPAPPPKAKANGP